MTPKRLRYLQQLLAHYATGWNFDHHPIFHTPVYLPEAEPSCIPDTSEIDSSPADLRKVTFTLKRGIITHGDILNPKPGRWIEAEGHIIEASAHEDGKWRPCPAIEGNRA